MTDRTLDVLLWGGMAATFIGLTGTAGMVFILNNVPFFLILLGGGVGTVGIIMLCWCEVILNRRFRGRFLD